MLDGMRLNTPYSSHAAPSWAYIDDYVWYILMWMDAHAWQGKVRDLDVASDTLELLSQWGSDVTCGGIVWMCKPARASASHRRPASLSSAGLLSSGSHGPCDSNGTERSASSSSGGPFGGVRDHGSFPARLIGLAAARMTRWSNVMPIIALSGTRLYFNSGGEASRR